MDRLLSYIGIDDGLVLFETSIKPDSDGISTDLKAKPIVPKGYKPSLQQAINLFEENTRDDLVGLDPDLLVKLGIAHQELGEHGQAIRYFQASIEIEPSFNSYYQLSYEYRQIEEYVEAEKIITKLLDDNSEDAHLWKVLGMNLSSQGRMEEAENAFHKAIDLQPDYFDIWLQLSMTYEKQGKKEQAESLMRGRETVVIEWIDFIVIVILVSRL